MPQAAFPRACNGGKGSQSPVGSWPRARHEASGRLAPRGLAQGHGSGKELAPAS